jgi:two-component system nitrate/nitrite response regulator NarL
MTAMEPLRILLVDDHILFRKGIAALLSTRPEITVVGEASDGLDGVEQARQMQPDLILMDIEMPDCNGLEAVKLIKQEMPQIKIIMLTVSDSGDDLFAAIKHGAQGYLLKESGARPVIFNVGRCDPGRSPNVRNYGCEDFAGISTTGRTA